MSDVRCPTNFSLSLASLGSRQAKNIDKLKFVGHRCVRSYASQGKPGRPK